MPGVVDAHAIGIRPSGTHTFIDIHKSIYVSVTLEEAHAATEEIEKAILEVISPVDVTVHMKPVEVPFSQPP